MNKNELTFIDIISQSRKIFFYFTKKCNEYYSSGDDLRYYREVINRHRNSNNIESLIGDSEFIHKIYRTLELWNMNQRKARLTDEESFRKSVNKYKKELIELYKYKLHLLQYEDIHRKVIKNLKKVFCNLHVMDSKRRIVGVSKAMHFLLPDLVMPIDSKYTLPGFYGDNVYSNIILVEFAIYKDILFRSLNIVKSLKLTEKDVDNKKWGTSIPKLIDNAIIGILNYLHREGVEKFSRLLKKYDQSA